MALTASFYTGLSGLNAHARRLDVIGNNIANANTTGYKSSALRFANQFSRTISPGTPAGDPDAGTNPNQIGLGVYVSGTSRNFSDGSIAGTGDTRDVALEGRGFFVVQRGDDQSFTRAGGFRTNSDGILTTPDGDPVLGYGIDSNFGIERGSLGSLPIPIGSMTLTRATTSTNFQGNLRADGDVATTGTLIGLGSSATDGFGLIPSATVLPGAGNVLEPTSLLVEMSAAAAPNVPAFTAGQSIEVREARLGGGTLPTRTLTINPATTVQDLMDFLRDAFAIDTSSANPDLSSPGLALNTTTGRLGITGNAGTINQIDLDSADVRLLDGNGVYIGAPLTATTTVSAAGESTRTSFEVYDSLGAPVAGRLAMTLVARDANGTTWKYTASSFADESPSPIIGTGTIRFDTLGRLVTTTPVSVSIDRPSSGAASPLTFDLGFDETGLTSLAQAQSLVALTAQDGAPPGTLATYKMDADGVIVGTFTNGLTRPLGQLAVATFVNIDGLIDEGSNLFRVGPGSGAALIDPPRVGGRGSVVAGALEQSNVELGQEFIDLIQTSTGYSASSRVIRTADELMQQLLVLGR
ncbi:MAG: flagellar hook protein FlgE [Phycisphaerales bacterium]